MLQLQRARCLADVHGNSLSAYSSNLLTVPFCPGLPHTTRVIITMLHYGPLPIFCSLCPLDFFPHLYDTCAHCPRMPACWITRKVTSSPRQATSLSKLSDVISGCHRPRGLRRCPPSAGSGEPSPIQSEACRMGIRMGIQR
eukprot:3514708-Pyramimonas_sp.AAC.1